MDLTITCDRCKNQLTHVCNANVRTAVIQLLDWKPHGGMPKSVIKEGKAAGYYCEGDEDAPFISEAFLYSLLGKDDARTLMALLNGVLRDAGIDPHSTEIEAELSRLDEEREQEAARREKVSIEYNKRRKEREAAEKAAKKLKKKGK